MSWLLRISAVLGGIASLLTILIFTFDIRSVPDALSRIISHDRFKGLSYEDLSRKLDPGKRSTLRLENAYLNGLTLDTGDPRISVTRGEKLSGVVRLKIDSAWTESAIAFGMTPSWGDHATSAVDLGPFKSPVTGLIREVPIDLIVPSSPGEYYVIFAYRGEFEVAQLMSATGWTRGAPIWNDANDIAAWSPITIRRAINNGNVLVNYAIQERAVYVPASAIVVNVE